MPSQQQSSKTPQEIRQRYRTPPFVFSYFDELFKFDRDVCAENEEVALCKSFITPEQDGLKTSWGESGDFVWCNPPYDAQEDWVDKAISEFGKGVGSALLLPAFNGQGYWLKIAKNMTGYINIVGRISFLAPEDFKKDGKLIRKGEPVPGNQGGSCIVLFGEQRVGTIFVDRDEMRDKYDLSELLG